MLEETPPPTKYLTVKVVFVGTTPNVFVFKKLDGSIPWFNLLTELANPNPTFFVFGRIISSAILVSPLPNCKSNVLSEFTFTANLYGTFCISKIYGTTDAEELSSPPFDSVFALSIKTLSCAKYGTSYHFTLPLLDVTDDMAIILSSVIVTFGYY